MQMLTRLFMFAEGSSRFRPASSRVFWALEKVNAGMQSKEWAFIIVLGIIEAAPDP